VRDAYYPTSAMWFSGSESRSSSPKDKSSSSSLDKKKMTSDYSNHLQQPGFKIKLSHTIEISNCDDTYNSEYNNLSPHNYYTSNSGS